MNRVYGGGEFTSERIAGLTIVAIYKGDLYRGRYEAVYIETLEDVALRIESDLDPDYTPEVGAHVVSIQSEGIEGAVVRGYTAKVDDGASLTLNTDRGDFVIQFDEYSGETFMHQCYYVPKDAVRV